MKWWWWMEVINAWMSCLLSVMRLVWITRLGLQEHGTAQSLGISPCTPPRSLHPFISLPVELPSLWGACCMNGTNINAQQHTNSVSVYADAYFERSYGACLSISKHSKLAVQSVAHCSLILCPNITCWVIAMHVRKKSNQLSQPLLMNRVIWIKKGICDCSVCVNITS